MMTDARIGSVGDRERVSVWCGTSVGAINAAMLGSLAHLPVEEQARAALDRWRAMRKRHVMAPITGRGGVRTLTRLIGHAVGLPGVGLASLLDASPLQASLDRWIDWGRLRRNVDRGVVDSVCVDRHLAADR
jgi:NTE family protein